MKHVFAFLILCSSATASERFVLFRTEDEIAIQNIQKRLFALEKSKQQPAKGSRTPRVVWQGGMPSSLPMVGYKWERWMRTVDGETVYYWKEVPKVAKKSTVRRGAVYYSAWRSYARWTWPGNLRSHMAGPPHNNDRNWCNTVDPQTLIRAHDAYHERYGRVKEPYRKTDGSVAEKKPNRNSPDYGEKIGAMRGILDGTGWAFAGAAHLMFGQSPSCARPAASCAAPRASCAAPSGKVRRVAVVPLAPPAEPVRRVRRSRAYCPS